MMVTNRSTRTRCARWCRWRSARTCTRRSPSWWTTRSARTSPGCSAPRSAHCFHQSCQQAFKNFSLPGRGPYFCFSFLKHLLGGPYPGTVKLRESSLTALVSSIQRATQLWSTLTISGWVSGNCNCFQLIKPFGIVTFPSLSK